MFKIDRDANRIVALEEPTFSELGFKERAHIQEWIAHNPRALDEPLLIIQKEFAGFSDTNERLDLLALDKQGALVLIENKLDDAGRNVTWQALKYASYCSRFTRDDIRKIYHDYLTKIASPQSADEKLCEFFEVDDVNELKLNIGFTQRIILIAAKFRKEVTSTVLWLANFKIRLQCFQTTPYRMGHDLFLSIEQVIPTKNSEDFMVGLANKALDEVEGAAAEKDRYALRREFWARLIKKMNSVSTLFASVSATKQSWLGTSSGVRGLSLNFVATQSFGRVELYIDRQNKTINEAIYDEILLQRDLIEENFGETLEWQRLEAKRACRIKYEVAGDVFDREQWPQLIESLSDYMPRLERALEKPLKHINDKIKSGQFTSTEDGIKAGDDETLVE
ncbi:DUF4268 domain-containing protein [Methylobacterium ajmalii]|uniref:DUF4268 domain-containing protein n=1 Tax=Methylobacterium ajmalii TaxID=2738439 RepID=A0ABU9ZSM5_9HYPH